MVFISEEIRSQPLLLVGCGGIGCEVIKNLLLVGFNNIQMIDLDTIDVSNLNRQFLFNKSHINQSKSIISAKVATSLFANHQTDKLNIKPIHGSILNTDYDVKFFKQFSFVINALDNRQARNHVNRMCLAADIPLIESGTEGYLGQTFVIKKNVTACYECTGPKTDQKTFASCTIRNTPSLPIHCIVWAKHLFNQLFGEEVDEDNEVSPDMNDPELLNSNDKENLDSAALNDEATKTKPPSTRKWAESNNYDPVLLFDKLFRIDIEYLHKMDKLWKNRTKPIVLHHDQLDNEQIPASSTQDNSSQTDSSSEETYSLQDQKMLSLKECFQLFSDSLDSLKKRLSVDQFLVWDKDDEPALDFVTAVSNLRSFCFHIERKSKFDVKSMAGNIIPAISSTNSIIGGLMVIQLMNLFRKLTKLTEEQKLDKNQIKSLFKSTCKQVFLRKVSTNVGNLIASYECFEQNPNCMVCCTGHIPEIEIKFNFEQVTMSDFIEQFVIKKLNFVCPDVMIDGEAKIIWSKDDFEEYTDQEKEDYKTRFVNAYSWSKNYLRLKIEDLLQDTTVILTLINEEFSLNDNEGVFYKMNIVSNGVAKNDNDIDDDLPSASTKSSNSELSNEVVNVVEDSTDNLNNGNQEKVEENQVVVEEEPSVDLCEKVVTSVEKTNGKERKHQNGNSDKEIVIIDSEDEDISIDESGMKNTHLELLRSHDESICEILDDDDDLQLIDEMKEPKEKRKIYEIDSLDDDSEQSANKKLRVDDST